MSKQKNILFIINPISGTGKQRTVEKLIEKWLDKERYQFEIKYTESAGHATTIAAEERDKFDVVAAVGGDGSVNETGKSMIHQSASLGIIPTGSGNGLARHLAVPMDLPSAVKSLNEASLSKIDSATINNEVFIGTAGVGFDAHIGKKFDEAPTRGFWTYFKLTVSEFFSYQPQAYKMVIDGVEVSRTAFIICFGNSNQWGNNAFISPDSELNDGYLRVNVVKKMPFALVPFFALKLFRKKLNSSKYYETFKAKEIELIQKGTLAHVDGEPVNLGSNLKIKVVPNSLNVWV